MLAWSKAPGESDALRTGYAYDAMDRVTSVSKAVPSLPVSVSNSYTYEHDRVKTLTHSNTAEASTTYTFNYGAFGLPSSILVGQRTLISNTYDTAGRTFNLLNAAYGNGASIAYSYDSHDRVTGIRFNGDAADRFTFQYDNCGALGLVRDTVNLLETRYTYDFAGRLVRIETKGTDGNTYSNKFEWDYDDAGRVSTLRTWVNDRACNSHFSYDNDNRTTGFSIGAIDKTWAYDSYGRISSILCKHQDNTRVTTTPAYVNPDASHASAQVASWRNQALNYDKTYSYTYDDLGNILSISDGASSVSYAYDALGQLTRENNQAAGKTWVFSYDAGGNILSRVEYAYTTGELGEPLNTLAYGYDDTLGWKDLLTSYAGQARSYDTIGNLTSDGTWTYTWQGGRQLASMAKDGTSVSFAYDEKGLRLSKTVNDAVTRYTYSQGELIHVLDGSDRMTIRRDPNGQPMTIGFNGSEHFYLYNAQGDVVAIANYSGEVVVEYTYDAWGNPLSCTGSLADTLGKKNPFRYRGYVYDEETGLYYLNSRYYDPRVGRFICADRILPTNRMTNSNLFVYCGNNSIMQYDPDGQLSWNTILASLISDTAGRTILLWYLYAGGLAFKTINGYYGKYMKKMKL